MTKPFKSHTAQLIKRLCKRFTAAVLVLLLIVMFIPSAIALGNDSPVLPDEDIPETLTRAQLEEAVLSVALAYYMKNPYMQYDSTHLTDMNANLGGLIRLTAESSPEGRPPTSVPCCCLLSHCLQLRLRLLQPARQSVKAPEGNP